MSLFKIRCIETHQDKTDNIDETNYIVQYLLVKLSRISEDLSFLVSRDESNSRDT